MESQQKSKIKLFFISDNWFPDIGGLENSILLLAKNISIYYDIEILTSSDKQGHAFDSGVKVITFQIEKSGYYQALFNYIKKEKRIRKDIIVHFFGTSYFWPKEQVNLIHKIKLQSIPVILKIPTLGHGKKYLSKHFNTSLQLIDTYIALTPAIKQELVSIGVNTNQIAIIPNGVDTKKYSMQRNCNIRELDSVKIGFAGRFTEQKNLIFLIEALNLVDSKNRPKLIFKGKFDNKYNDGVDIRKYQNDYIRILQADLDIINFYNEIDVYISPSMAEGMPNSVLEAMACSLPIFLSNIPGHIELVPNKSQLFSIKENGQLVDILRNLRILKDTGRLKTLGHESRLRVENLYSIELIRKCYVELYEKLI